MVMQIWIFITVLSCWFNSSTPPTPKFKLVEASKVKFNSFVDCNMAEVWVGDTFRIFPGKYGEDPLWGYAKDLKYSDGKNASVVFQNSADQFINPIMPPNVPIGKKGLHDAVWFETVYQDKKDATGKTMGWKTI